MNKQNYNFNDFLSFRFYFNKIYDGLKEVTENIFTSLLICVVLRDSKIAHLNFSIMEKHNPINFFKQQIFLRRNQKSLKQINLHEKFVSQ